MVTKLLFVWFLGVVAFFALWAILAKVIHHFNKNKQEKSNTEQP